MNQRQGARSAAVVGMLFVFTTGFAAESSDPYTKAGPLAVETIRFDWHDAKRDREVPARIYFPKEGAGPFPLIVFSHGLGGSREGYEYLGRHWASHGYVAVHIQHLGSDEAVWRGSVRPLQDMRNAAANLENAVDRPLDVRFAIDQMLALNTSDARFRGRIDSRHIGAAGHSFGAFTTMAVAGQTFGPRQTSLGDSRVCAAIAMSTPVPRALTERSYQQVHIPILHLTGTKDDSPIGDTPAEQRRDPFDHLQPPQYLVTFNGADHMVFAGRSGLRGDRSKDGTFHELTLGATTAFWDAWLKSDEQARTWLESGGLKKALGIDGILELKTQPKPKE